MLSYLDGKVECPEFGDSKGNKLMPLHFRFYNSKGHARWFFIAQINEKPIK